MQLSRLYSNLPDILSPIGFNHGANANRLNIVLGEVKHPRDQKKDSHNLGKTILLQLIDFLMLKGWSQESFLFRHRDRFANFVFYLEIALNTGGYATIRRSVDAPTRIALARHQDPNADFDGAPDDTWDHPDLPIDEAIKLLDAWLDLRALQPYDYRKAITYCVPRAIGAMNCSCRSSNPGATFTGNRSSLTSSASIKIPSSENTS
ncbi:uncharacterized protein YydD (DUF2326 family) [Rhizobium sp. BK313]|uniref:hypothetical protein n=1 Tax=Rhizobium sp. BK313 TaxID=2587081 RepID=UPI0014151A50|nr:hypothetical protein [Rhizobium sp. BK313]MBB3454400.1 uncharacterized protein YydD (DUF2326 family) [Rhizobium sp. BK313]